jgi:hypothetical protein
MEGKVFSYYRWVMLAIDAAEGKISEYCKT